ncbi:MBL fold metallo-hydrolase [Actinomadura keratinilytica]
MTRDGGRREECADGGDHLVGSCHLHGGGLGGAAAHRPGLRAAAGPSAAAPGRAPPARAAVADAVLVSHLHADHLHLPSLARLAAGTKLLVPKGAVRAVPGLRRLARLDVVEVEPGDTEKVGPVTVRVVPALHDGRRMPVGPRRSPALGFVVDGRARTYFAGDTGLFDTMAEETGPLDVALLPVGGWGPGLGHHHLDPARAAEALRRLAPASAVPVHYGTYWPIGMDAVRPHEFHSPVTSSSARRR